MLRRGGTQNNPRFFWVPPLLNTFSYIRTEFGTNVMMENTSPPSLQDIKGTMETSYACIFPETFKMMKIFLALPIGTAAVERSFSHLKMIKTRLCSRLSDCSVAQLMLIEGPEIDAVEFEEILEIFKNRIIE